jgi:hypothetical protein
MGGVWHCWGAARQWAQAVDIAGAPVVMTMVGGKIGYEGN